jgi:hypothetical protein
MLAVRDPKHKEYKSLLQMVLDHGCGILAKACGFSL